jgi:hypothetical protein
MKKIQLLFLVWICISAQVFCQAPAVDKDSTKKPPQPPDRNMFGLHIPRGLTKTSEGLAEGYVMFPVPNSALVYLINRKGEVVHQWKGNYGGPTVSPYLQNDGSIITNAADPDFPVFAGGGEAGRIQKISWDSKMLWDFEYATEEYLHHHDFTVMPNGHILAIAWEARTPDEVLAAGRKPKMIPKAGLWPDRIVEIEPQGKSGGKVVWEWHIWDHLVQDYDAKKANFGKPADHPELLDFNVGDTLQPPITQDSMDILRAQGRVPWRNQTPENSGSDLYHFNAVKYNAELDQIAFSSPGLSEIFIIDHSTTTKQAAGHTGGRGGKGGDFLYRWGNPQNYGRGDSADQKLFGQHDVRWIEKGKPGAGNLTVFDNDVPAASHMPYSAVYELATPVDSKGNYSMEKNGAYGPEKPSWMYMAPDTFSFFSGFISGAHRMSNGNTFIDEGAKARFFEVTKEGNIVWEYLNPYRGDIHKPNGDPINPIPLTYFAFRSTFIPADHPGLANKKLEPLNPQPAVFKLPPPPPPGDKK